MAAAESARVCSMSPANKAAVLGAAPPFTQADPLEYNIAEGDSPASMRTGKTIASKQHIAERSIGGGIGWEEICIFPNFQLSYARNRLQVNVSVVTCYTPG
jgi:hypothetical protein